MRVSGTISADTASGNGSITIDPEHVTVTGAGFPPEERVWFRVVYHYATDVWKDLTIAGNRVSEPDGTATAQLPRSILPYDLESVSAEISDSEIG